MHVVATAGHVDHGKSTLVRALTGMEPDRYAEERRRGLTIDLGFAWTTLASGTEMAFVDVPGHARFVPTMLAGVGPVPAVLMVVAADEGWRQQSAEHLAVLDAFGVRHGVLAVTRSDRADPVPATEQAVAMLRRSTLTEVEAVAVSGVTGAGLPDLRAALDRLATRLPRPDVQAAVRLWVDRAFTLPGAGTVVTGTLGGGTLRVGDEVALVPSGQVTRIRGLESLRRAAPSVAAVARVAVNLRGIPPSQARRGQALVTPGAWPLPTVFDARLSRPAADLRGALMLYAGSAAVPARLRPLGGDRGRDSGEDSGRDRNGLVRVYLATPLPLRLGDRAVLRDPSRHDVLAGLTVLDVAPPELRRRGSAAARAAALRELDGRPDVASEVARRGAVRRMGLIAMGVPSESLSELRADPATSFVVAGEWLVDAGRWREWVDAVAAAVADHANRFPLDPMPHRGAVAHAAELPDVVLLDHLLEPAGLVADGGRLRRRGAVNPLPLPSQSAVEDLRRRLTAAPFRAAEAPALAEAGLTRSVLAAAVRAGALAAVGEGIWLLPDWAGEALLRLGTLPQPFTLSDARLALDTTRRVAVPVLEALDAARRTRRLDGSRRVVVGVG